MNIKDNIYIKIKIRVAFNKRDFTIYQNIKTSYILVSHVFLTNFSDIDIIKIFKPVKIVSYLGPIIKFQKWTIQIYYVLKIHCNRTPDIAQFYIEVQMVDKLNVNLLLFNIILYKYKIQADFEVYLFIFLKIEDFKVSFQILKIISQLIIWKMILKESIQLELKETVYI